MLSSGRWIDSIAFLADSRRELSRLATSLGTLGLLAFHLSPTNGSVWPVLRSDL